MLENKTFEKSFVNSAKEEGRDEVQKITEKIRYLRRDAFVWINPFHVKRSISTISRIIDWFN